MNQVLRTTVWIAIFVFASACEGEKPDNKPVSQKAANADKPVGAVCGDHAKGKP
jgi:hypothetical protein